MHPSKHKPEESLRHYQWQLAILLVFIILFICFKAANAQGKKRLDLEDLSIKGELLNDGRLNILGRERLSLENYVKFRTNYRQIMVQALPTPAPKKMD